MTESPKLPPLYELVALDEVDNALSEASRRAIEGAEEGTLVWARTETDARDGHGKRTSFAPGNLSVALVLRPEFPVTTALQLSLLAQVSACSALAALLSPGMALSYRWPTDVLLNASTVCTVSLRSAPVRDQRLAWMTIGLSANLVAHADDRGFTATSVIEEEGRLEFDAECLLESYARQFLVWGSRWADEGFEPVQRTWLGRAHGIGQPVRIRFRGTIVEGALRGLDDDGAVVLSEGGATKRVSLAQFWGVGPDALPSKAGARGSSDGE